MADNEDKPTVPISAHLVKGVRLLIGRVNAQTNRLDVLDRRLDDTLGALANTAELLEKLGFIVPALSARVDALESNVEQLKVRLLKSLEPSEATAWNAAAIKGEVQGRGGPPASPRN